jgi:phosphate/sulfate permease
MPDSNNRILKRILAETIIVLVVVLPAFVLWWLFLKVSLIWLIIPLSYFIAGWIILSILLWLLVQTAKKHRFQYSLRTLLIIVTVVALILGLLNHPIRQAQRRAQQHRDAVLAMEVISKFHGGINVRDNGDSLLPDRIGSVYLTGSNCTDSDLEILTGLSKLSILQLENTQVTDKGLTHLQKLPNLKVVCLGGTKVTEEGIKTFQTVLPNCKVDMLTPAQRRAKGLSEHLPPYKE